MRVFISHAEADQASADELKAGLQQHGVMAESETGAKGFSFLSPTDVVVALWSQKAIFSVQRLLFERRMLDAWADGRLVLVKLDHGFLPVGLRDLSFIDATFEPARSTATWGQVARAVREVREQAMRERASPPPQAPSPGPGGSSGTGGLGGGVGAPPPAPMPSRRQRAPGDGTRSSRRARGGPAVLWHLLSILVVAGLGAGLVWLDVPYAVPIVAVAAALTLFVPLLAYGRGSRSATMAKDESGEQPLSMRAPMMEEAAVAPGALLFISYAHADNAAVEPVVKIVEANGREVWIDKGGIPAGEGWAGEIVRAIKSARGVIVMCSRKAFESDHIKREVYLADRYKKPMLPLFIEEASPPEDFEYFFASVQWLELFRLPEADRPGAVAKALAGV
jgi:hypothetical protein